jgi:hypothetical protein
LEFEELLGVGGMGAVYRAQQKSLKRMVAVKILPAIASLGEANLQFQHEAHTLARLNHPNIVTIFNYGFVEPWHYIEMEFVGGPSLRQVLRSGGLSIEDSLRVVIQLAEALAYAHQLGVVHRDVKPENVLLSGPFAAGDLTVKLADFGIAKLLSRECGPPMVEPDRDERVAGTPRYVAPEQLTTPAEVSGRADIYALGIVLVELATGSVPAGGHPHDSLTGIAELDRVLDRCLPPDPAERYDSAAHLASDLKQIQSIVANRLDADTVELTDDLAAPPRWMWRRTASLVAPPMLIAAILLLGEWLLPPSDSPNADRAEVAPPGGKAATDSEPERDAGVQHATSAPASTAEPIVLTSPKWSVDGFERYLRVDYEALTPVPIGRRIVFVIEAANGQRAEQNMYGHDMSNKGTLRSRFHPFGRFPPPYEVFLENEPIGPFGNRVRVSNILMLQGE